MHPGQTLALETSSIVAKHCHNPLALTGQLYPPAIEKTLPRRTCENARQAITSWANYAPTPLYSLKALASHCNVASVHYKDEGPRFGLGSFKALGGAYAVQTVLQKVLDEKIPGTAVTLKDVADLRYPEICSEITVVTATDGNHGRSVAWGAQRFGCQCVIYLHAEVSEGRQRAIEALGAKVVRITGHYDNSVHQAERDAKDNDWFVVSDTSWPGYTEIPRQVMAGYTVMTGEAMDQLPDNLTPTHVFIQGGCGGLAGTVCADLWRRYGLARPRTVVVEPESAACLYLSALAGEPRVASITAESLMAGLSCGEVSLVGWQILALGAQDFVTITDESVAPLMRLLAENNWGDQAIVAGESAIAGLAGLIAARADPQLSDKLGLSQNSHVLLFGTEGATDLEVYRQLVKQ
jgi:diaminopropionate ammonia-lyase